MKSTMTKNLEMMPRQIKAKDKLSLIKAESDHNKRIPSKAHLKGRIASLGMLWSGKRNKAGLAFLMTFECCCNHLYIISY